MRSQLIIIYADVSHAFKEGRSFSCSQTFSCSEENVSEKDSSDKGSFDEGAVQEILSETTENSEDKEGGSLKSPYAIQGGPFAITGRSSSAQAISFATDLHSLVTNVSNEYNTIKQSPTLRKMRPQVDPPSTGMGTKIKNFFRTLLNKTLGRESSPETAELTSSDFQRLVELFSTTFVGSGDDLLPVMIWFAHLHPIICDIVKGIESGIQDGKRNLGGMEEYVFVVLSSACSYATGKTDSELTEEEEKARGYMPAFSEFVQGLG